MPTFIIWFYPFPAPQGGILSATIIGPAVSADNASCRRLYVSYCTPPCWKKASVPALRLQLFCPFVHLPMCFLSSLSFLSFLLLSASLLTSVSLSPSFSSGRHLFCRQYRPLKACTSLPEAGGNTKGGPAQASACTGPPGIRSVGQSCSAL